MSVPSSICLCVYDDVDFSFVICRFGCGCVGMYDCVCIIPPTLTFAIHFVIHPPDQSNHTNTHSHTCAHEAPTWVSIASSPPIFFVLFFEEVGRKVAIGAYDWRSLRSYISTSWSGFSTPTCHCPVYVCLYMCTHKTHSKHTQNTSTLFEYVICTVHHMGRNMRVKGDTSMDVRGSIFRPFLWPPPSCLLRQALKSPSSLSSRRYPAVLPPKSYLCALSRGDQKLVNEAQFRRKW